MTKKFKKITAFLTVGLLMGGYLFAGSLSDVHAAELAPEKAKWLKENKIGPYQEDKVDYDALYEAAKKEGKVVVYSSTSRGPKSFALGFHKKYPGIKVEWNTIGTGESLKRLLAEQNAGIYSVDLINASDPPTQFNVYAPGHMLFSVDTTGTQRRHPQKLAKSPAGSSFDATRCDVQLASTSRQAAD